MSDLCPVAVSQDSTAIEDQPETANESHLLLLRQKKYCDVTFTFPNVPDRIEAHEFCLKARSPVFEQVFRMRKSGHVRRMEIEISESTPERFQKFLEFIYSDVFEVDIVGALDLLQLAQKYKVQPLAKKCELLLKTEIQVEDSVQVFETARQYGRQDLMDRAGELMVKSFLDLRETGALASADEDTVLFLLEQDDLKDKLKNVIMKIRFTNMTPYEFNTVVAPTGLLSAEETLSVYSYLLGDETTRKDLGIKFNIKRRKMEKLEKVINFYPGRKLGFVKAATFPKQSKGFQAERMQHMSQVWSDYHEKKVMITGIRVWWPRLNRGCRKPGFSLNVNVSIREYSGPFNEENYTFRFHKTLLKCKEDKIEEIPVDPPVEFISGRSYSVFVEDRSTSDLHDSYRDGLFVYDGLSYSSEMTPEASVDVDSARLTLKGIHCNTEIDGQACSDRPLKIAVVTGLTINLVQ